MFRVMREAHNCKDSSVPPGTKGHVYTELKKISLLIKFKYAHCKHIRSILVCSISCSKWQLRYEELEQHITQLKDKDNFFFFKT